MLTTNTQIGMTSIHDTTRKNTLNVTTNHNSHKTPNFGAICNENMQNKFATFCLSIIL
jgi:hypothetical protein